MKKQNFTPKILLCGAYVLVGLLSLSSISLAQVPYIKKAPMPTPRSALCTAVIDGKIYAIGGLKNEEAVLSVVQVYDPVTDIWDTKAPMPTARCVLDCAVVDGKIYVFGGSKTAGSSIISTVEVYDTATDTWDTKAPMPAPRSDVAVEAVNGKIYVIGGSKRTGSIWAGLNTVEEYDPVTDTWTTKSNMPTARWSLGTCVIDGKIYAIGGNIKYPNIASAVEVYDPAADTWSEKAPMPTARYSLSTCFVNEKIFAFGGWRASGGDAGDPIYKIVEEYDVNTNTWSRNTDMPLTIALLSTETVNGKIYIIGGTSKQHTFNSLKTIYEYDPHLDLLPLIEKIEVDKCYAKPGADSVCITAEMTDPTGIALLAEIEAPDQSPIDSIKLFDDGMHNDGAAVDGLYANFWPVSSAEEQPYYVDLKVKRVDTDTVIQYMNNMALFTTIGPVELESYTFSGDDTIPNPGDQIRLELILKNNSSVVTATNIKAKLISLDTLVYAYASNRFFGDIVAGEYSKSNGIYIIEISEEYPVNTPISILAEITSDDYIFWRDTFSIMIEEPVNNIDNITEPINRIYPNPTRDELNIDFAWIPDANTTIELMDLSGKIVYTSMLEANTISHTIDLQPYTEGLYLIHIHIDQYSYTEKVIKVE